MLLLAENLTIGYKNLIIQRNLNLNVDAGKLICLVGINGCGKSTLLRTLAGLQPSLSGRIFINSKNISKLTDYQRSMLFSLVLTDKIDVENLTVFELVVLGRYPYTSWSGAFSENDKKIAENALYQVNLLHKKNALLNAVSDGEKQRAVIAKALAQDTPLVLLDEPTSHLDLPNRIEIMMLLRRLSVNTRKSFILSTHELDLAVQISDYIWLMDKNETISGVPEDLMLEQKIQKSFENKNFNFISEDGHYKLLQPVGTLKVAVRGENEQAKWLKRAFIRCGIIADKNSDIIIEVIDNQFIINDFKTVSIEELLNFLSDFQNKQN
jgi:iron complex transport system ATP-binding protein